MVDKLLFAKCWKMEAISSDIGQSWRITKHNNYLVPLTEFLKSFPELCDDADSHYGLPHPSKIFGLFLSLLYYFDSHPIFN